VLNGMKVNRKNSIIVLVSVLLVTALVFLVAFQTSDKHKAVKTVQTDKLANIYSSLPTEGSRHATVHIVEFGDYKCPDCKEFNEKVVPYLYDKYVRTGKAQFHFVNFTFVGPDSPYLAEFAEAVHQELGDKTFWRFHNAIYTNQVDESKIWGTEDFLTNILKSVTSNDSDVKKVVDSVQLGKYKKTIEQQNDLAKQLKLKGTPSLLVNGKEIEPTNLQDWVNNIEKAINRK
jgi:protein-disulfide isomerase